MLSFHPSGLVDNREGFVVLRVRAFRRPLGITVSRLMRRVRLYFLQSTLVNDPSVPIYDAREQDLDLASDYPCVGLPPVDFELAVGDIVWIGFHAHTYTRVTPESIHTPIVSTNVIWVALLGRGGLAAWDAVTESSPVPDLYVD